MWRWREDTRGKEIFIHLLRVGVAVVEAVSNLLRGRLSSLANSESPNSV